MGGSGGGVLVGAGVDVGMPVGKITGVGGKGWNGVGVASDEGPATSATITSSCGVTSNCDEDEMGTTVNPGIEQAVMLRMIFRTIEIWAIRLNNGIEQPF